MVSVVIADYVQFVMLSFGLLLTTALVIHHVGWTNIFDTVQQEMGVGGFDPTVAENVFGWEYIIWMGFLGLVSCGIWPTSVARALVMDSPRAVKRQYMFSSISFLIRFVIPYCWGICAFVFVMQHPGLKELFFPAGLIGLLTAGMIAAFMSIHDSYLLC